MLAEGDSVIRKNRTRGNIGCTGPTKHTDLWDM